MTRTTQNQVKELKRVGALLSKYADAYSNAVRKDHEPSSRIYKWIDFYNESRGTAAWDAYDCFA